MDENKIRIPLSEKELNDNDFYKGRIKELRRGTEERIDKAEQLLSEARRILSEDPELRSTLEHYATKEKRFTINRNDFDWRTKRESERKARSELHDQALEIITDEISPKEPLYACSKHWYISHTYDHEDSQDMDKNFWKINLALHDKGNFSTLSIFGGYAGYQKSIFGVSLEDMTQQLLKGAENIYNPDTIDTKEWPSLIGFKRRLYEITEDWMPWQNYPSRYELSMPVKFESGEPFWYSRQTDNDKELLAPTILKPVDGTKIQGDFLENTCRLINSTTFVYPNSKRQYDRDQPRLRKDLDRCHWSYHPLKDENI